MLALALAACRPTPHPADSPEPADPADTDTDEPLACPAAAAPGVLQEVTGTPASPYFVRHPDVPGDAVPSVVYLPGGTGDRATALRVDQLYIASGGGREAFRVAVAYTDGARNFSAIPERAVQVRDELLACWGGDPARVHLAGTSNGGVGSFTLLAADPTGWASLLGAPGVWTSFDAATLAATLAARPVLMAVGADDAGWLPTVLEQSTALAAAGATVTYVPFEGQDHVVDEAFDETVLFDFWRAVP